MDKTEKFLQRLTISERKEVINLVTQILEGNVVGLDIKKLKGYKDVYRARLGNVRIIFKRQNADIFILEISRRNDNTYRNF